MRWLRDRSGEFPIRLHFSTLDEIDVECERLFSLAFFHCFGQPPEFPLSTDQLLVMVEQYADIDLYAHA